MRRKKKRKKRKVKMTIDVALERNFIGENTIRLTRFDPLERSLPPPDWFTPVSICGAVREASSNYR